MSFSCDKLDLCKQYTALQQKFDTPEHSMVSGDHLTAATVQALFRRGQLKALVDIHSEVDGIGGGYLSAEEINNHLGRPQHDREAGCCRHDTP